MGMAIQLNEVFPGGFEVSPPERRPHRYAATDLFSNDPDRNWEAAYAITSVEGLVRLLIEHHVVNQTHITYVPSLIENSLVSTKPHTAKFRGEESLRSILKDLALRAQASWGVDALGRFFFIRRRTALQSTFRLGRDLVSLEESRDRELIFNRLLLTGDYIYDQRDHSGQLARRVFRWRASYFEPDSCQSYGNRRLRLWVPWLRTQSDSVAFAREFFRLYGWPSARYSVETVPQTSVLIPWDGPVSIEDADGVVLATGLVEKVRVLFDHAPRFRLEVGPEDPREQWPEPPQDERWEIPDHVPSNGGQVVVTDGGLPNGGGGGGGGGHTSSGLESVGGTGSDSLDHSSEDHSSNVSSVDSRFSSDGPQSSSNLRSVWPSSSSVDSGSSDAPSTHGSSHHDSSTPDSNQYPSSDHPSSHFPPSSHPPSSHPESSDQSSESPVSSNSPPSSSRHLSNPYSYWQDE